MKPPITLSEQIKVAAACRRLDLPISLRAQTPAQRMHLLDDLGRNGASADFYDRLAAYINNLNETELS